MAEACGLLCCPCTFVPESELSHTVQAHHSLVPKLSHHEWKNLGFSSLKNMISVNACIPTYTIYMANNLHGAQLFFSERSERCFSSDDVFSCEATGDDDRACA